MLSSQREERDTLTTAYAPGKAILFGEHAVVYGRPAIAVPVTPLRACAVVKDAPSGQGLVIEAVDLNLQHHVGTAITTDDPAYPLEATVRDTLEWLEIEIIPDVTLTVSSTVPIARGLGSGAAIATKRLFACDSMLKTVAAWAESAWDATRPTRMGRQKF